MNNFQQTDPWCLTEEGLQVNNHFPSEDIFSIGNGQIVQRANFEEYYSGDSIMGSYIEGINYPENAEVPKWKMESDKATINAPNWVGVIVRLNDETLDLATWEVQNFKRVLNMHEGLLERTFEAISAKGHHIQVSVKRFLSMSEKEVGAISYSIKSINFEGRISFMPIVDGDLKDQLQVVNEPVWNVLQTKTQQDVSHVWVKIRRTDFHICIAQTYVFYKNNEQLNIIPSKIEKEKSAGFNVGTDVKKGDTLCLNKYVAILNSLNHPRNEMTDQACTLARASKQKSWNRLFEEHTAEWAEKWKSSGTFEDDLPENQKNNRYKQFRIFQGFTGF